VQQDPTDPLSAEPARVQQCFSDLVCQVCGEPVLSIDDMGWVLAPRANVGGACCTRCMHLAIRVCPRLAQVPEGAFVLWAVRDKREYGWQVVDGRAKGHIIPVQSRAQRFAWQEFMDHCRAWRHTRGNRAVDQ